MTCSDEEALGGCLYIIVTYVINFLLFKFVFNIGDMDVGLLYYLCLSAFVVSPWIFPFEVILLPLALLGWLASFLF